MLCIFWSCSQGYFIVDIIAHFRYFSGTQAILTCAYINSNMSEKRIKCGIRTYREITLCSTQVLIANLGIH